MKLCGYIFVIFTPFAVFCQGNKMYGKYKASCLSIESVQNIPRDNVDWKVYLKKVSRWNSVVKGFVKVKRKIGPITERTTVEIWGNGGYRNIMMDKNDQRTFCEKYEDEDFLSRYTGNITLTDDCYLTPGIWNINDVECNTEMHKYSESSMYGKFRVTTKVEAGGKLVFGTIFVIDVQRLSIVR